MYIILQFLKLKCITIDPDSSTPVIPSMINKKKYTYTKRKKENRGWESGGGGGSSILQGKKSSCFPRPPAHPAPCQKPSLRHSPVLPQQGRLTPQARPARGAAQGAGLSTARRPASHPGAPLSPVALDTPRAQTRASIHHSLLKGPRFLLRNSWFQDWGKESSK